MLLPSAHEGLIVEKDGSRIFIGKKAQGLCGLILAISAHGADMAGAKLICDSLGKVGARLIQMVGIEEVIVRTITLLAYRYLQQGGTKVVYGEIVEADPKDRPTEYELQNISEQFIEPQDLLKEMKTRLMRALEHHIFPTDDTLLVNLSSRLGVGGGGT